MLKFFRIPFAVSGDRTAIPDAVDVNGNVSYTAGYGFDYQRQKTDPAAKNTERDKMNSLLFEITTAVAELQAQGVPDFITTALNGGTPYSYGVNALVRWTDNDLYLSLQAANVADPSDPTMWAKLPTAARIQDEAFSAAVAAGTVDALTVAFTPAFAAWQGQAFSVRLNGANTSTTPTIAADGLAALTIVKGNNLPLIAGDLPGAGAWAMFKHDATLGKVVLLNPATGVAAISGDGAKAWVNFDGTGTPTIRKAYNVSSITDVGTGIWTVNFASALADANYCPLITVRGNTSAPFVTSGNQGTANTTAGFRITATFGNLGSDSSASFIDLAHIYAAVFD